MDCFDNAREDEVDNLLLGVVDNLLPSLVLVACEEEGFIAMGKEEVVRFDDFEVEAVDFDVVVELDGSGVVIKDSVVIVAVPPPPPTPVLSPIPFDDVRRPQKKKVNKFNLSTYGSPGYNCHLQRL